MEADRLYVVAAVYRGLWPKLSQPMTLVHATELVRAMRRTRFCDHIQIWEVGPKGGPAPKIPQITC